MLPPFVHSLSPVPVVACGFGLRKGGSRPGGGVLLGKLLGTNNNGVLTLIRIVAGGVMFPHGAAKLLGWFGGAGFSRTMSVLSHQGFPAPLVFLAICAEFFGSLGLILGCLSRVAAFSILADMAVAAFVVNFQFGFFANWQNNKAGEGIEYHLLMMGMALAVMVWGGGAFSVDRAVAASMGEPKQGVAA